jgi:hypothetical protein
MKLASLIAACFLFAATVSVDATPYVVTLEEIGSNVVADGSGEVDLSGLTYLSSGGPTGPYLNPGLEGSQFVIGATNSFDIYARFTGPSFGTGSGTSASTGTGDLVGFALNVQQLYVPFGYVSGDALSNSATWDDATFATLGVTPGNYTYAWGSLRIKASRLRSAPPHCRRHCQRLPLALSHWLCSAGAAAQPCVVRL